MEGQNTIENCEKNNASVNNQTVVSSYIFHFNHFLFLCGIMESTDYQISEHKTGHINQIPVD